MTPTVSVIIPTYNRANLLERAIRSVLSQTYRDFEIIVVDDASTDNTQEMLKERFKQEIDYGMLRIIRNETSLERSRSRNEAMEISKGEYIALLDDDDIWLPDHLESAVRFLKMEKDVGCVFSNFFLIPSESPSNAQLMFTDMANGKNNQYRKFCITGKLGLPCTAVFKRSAYELVGGFNAEISCYEDREFFSRIAMNYIVGFMSMPTVCHFLHPGTLSKPSAEIKEKILRIIEENAISYNYNFENELKFELLTNVCHSFIIFGNNQKARDYLFNAIKSDYRLLSKLDTWKLLLRVVFGKHFYLILKKLREL